MASFFTYYAFRFLIAMNVFLIQPNFIDMKSKKWLFFLLYGVILATGLIIGYFTDAIDISIYGYPVWNLWFFLFIIIIVGGCAIVPILVLSYKVFSMMKYKILKRRYFLFYVGIFCFSPLLFLIFFSNYLDIYFLRLITSVYSLLTPFWLYLIYYGIAKNLD
ncbi:MAG: hypothetical protein GF311_03955 [Candidatus Lokiarchaeota archaeon]|nr:hypothetical protein [Candidatus Lokiarchaeota archaeon]